MPRKSTDERIVASLVRRGKLKSLLATMVDQLAGNDYFIALGHPLKLKALCSQLRSPKESAPGKAQLKPGTFQIQLQ